MNREIVGLTVKKQLCLVVSLFDMLGASATVIKVIERAAALSISITGRGVMLLGIG